MRCDINWIAIDLPHQVWEAQAADGSGAYVILTRFIHNKLLFWANNLTRCYFSYLSPDYIAKKFSIIGLIIFCCIIWYLIIRRKYILLIILLLVPAILVIL